jgi:alpha-galactosidase
MAGVLGIGADIRRWTADERAEAARFVALYQGIRDVIHTGVVHLLGSPADGACAVQYTTADRVVVLAWHISGAAKRIRLRGLTGDYVVDGVRYGGAHLCDVGLPVTWRPDAAVVVLERA